MQENPTPFLLGEMVFGPDRCKNESGIQFSEKSEISLYETTKVSRIGKKYEP